MHMSVRERILTIRLMEKVKEHPSLAKAFATVEDASGDGRDKMGA